MGNRKKSWQEKRADSKDLPKVLAIDGKMSKRWGSGTVFIPAPREVDAIMKRVRSGKRITLDDIRPCRVRNVLSSSNTLRHRDGSPACWGLAHDD